MEELIDEEVSQEDIESIIETINSFSGEGKLGTKSGDV